MSTLDIALTDIPEGTPFQPEDAEVLLIRFGEDVTALAPTCPHFGLPLKEGVVRDGTLICPFHHACFNARTGKQTQPPGRGDLHHYDVVVRDGRVQVDLTDAPDHHAPGHVTQGTDSRRFVIAGSGAAGDACAHALRENGFEGVIEMISPTGVPLDRTDLSKSVLAGDAQPSDLTLTDRDALAGLDVALIDGTVSAVTVGQVTLADGGLHAFDGLLVAPGGAPRVPDMAGTDLPGVHLLRSAEDAEGLAKAVKGAKRAIFVGGGFIGMEGALALAKRDIDVTVVLRHDLPLANVLGTEIAQVILAEHRDAGVTFVTGAEVEAITGKTAATGVRLDDGRTLDADLVVLATGVRPATANIDGLPHDEDGGVATGADLSVPGLEGVFVGGDCARVPTAFGTARIEHWRVAVQHGRTAALSFLGQPAPEVDIPFFWTALGRNYGYVGHATDWDEIRIDGDPAEDFLAQFIKDGRVMAAVTAGRDADLADLHLQMKAAGGPIPV